MKKKPAKTMIRPGRFLLYASVEAPGSFATRDGGLSKILHYSGGWVTSENTHIGSITEGLSGGP
jgi:hypothetical protein